MFIKTDFCIYEFYSINVRFCTEQLLNFTNRNIINIFVQSVRKLLREMLQPKFTKKTYIFVKIRKEKKSKEEVFVKHFSTSSIILKEY